MLIAGSTALRLSVTKRLSGLVKAAGKTPSTVLQKQGMQSRCLFASSPSNGTTCALAMAFDMHQHRVAS